MKIKTVEKLYDLLSEDLSWRRKELIDLKLMIHSTNNPLLCRVGIAFLSAHFEGFIKQSANYYIVYVASQNIKLSDLNTNFLAIVSAKRLTVCTESNKISVYQRAIDSILASYSLDSFRIRYTPDHPVVRTEGNPTSKVIKEIFSTIGLDFTPYETKTNYVDSDLLSNRHGIVHGNRVYIDVSEFDSTYQVITDIIDSYFDQIMSAAINHSYLKSPSLDE